MELSKVFFAGHDSRVREAGSYRIVRYRIVT